jgi:hypothetical protein
MKGISSSNPPRPPSARGLSTKTLADAQKLLNTTKKGADAYFVRQKQHERKTSETALPKPPITHYNPTQTESKDECDIESTANSIINLLNNKPPIIQFNVVYNIVYKQMILDSQLMCINHERFNLTRSHSEPNLNARLQHQPDRSPLFDRNVAELLRDRRNVKLPQVIHKNDLYIAAKIYKLIEAMGNDAQDTLITRVVQRILNSMRLENVSRSCPNVKMNTQKPHHT